MTDSSQETRNLDAQSQRRIWLHAMLDNPEGVDWTIKNATKIAQNLDIDAEARAYIAPNGVVDLVDQFFADVNANLSAFAPNRENGVTLAVRDSVMHWLTLLSAHKSSVSNIVARGLSGTDGTKPAMHLYQTADVVWNISAEYIGNYNDTSRRVLLTIALGDILRHWLAHSNISDAKLSYYVERRLQQVSGAGRGVGQVLNTVASIWPNKDS